jgi:CheY-like chemotaxis protein/HPt (histidine-containing phosphotransfer) domain-containing protein
MLRALPRSASVPRVLIVDDDPVSLHFLATAVSGLGCSVVAAANAAEAVTAMEWAAFDLLLLDRRMPGGGGVELLAHLRTRHVRAPAIATSAELSPQIAAELRAAGFSDVIEKPVTLAQLQQSLQPYLAPLRPAAANSDDLLDDAAALGSVGSDSEALYALRRLFVEELSELERAWIAGAAAIEQERLHRLRASCGFCGAPALAEAARQLELALRGGANAQKPLEDFLALCRATRDALSSSLVVSR